MYAMYAIHGGEEDEEKARKKDPLRKPPMFQAQLAEFKKAVRLINKHATQEEYEWMLETSYSTKHRLKGAGIENRQAAIRGTPRPSDEDSEKSCARSWR